jgi:hypothetical protein
MPLAFIFSSAAELEPETLVSVLFALAGFGHVAGVLDEPFNFAQRSSRTRPPVYMDQS